MAGGGEAGALVAALRSALREVADPARAAGMRAYLKSDLPCLGVPMPVLRSAVRPVLDAHAVRDRTAYADAVLDLWRAPRWREERYAAIEVTGHRAYAVWQDPDALPLYDELVVTGAWWDLVDPVATGRVGPILRGHPDAVRPVVIAWSRDRDPWRRRTAILAQLTFKAATDPALLAAVIEPNLADGDFFIRKAIGWALRQYARTDPSWVRGFVARHDATLSALSRREALKHLG